MKTCPNRTDTNRFIHTLSQREKSMKNTGICPKCDSKNVKINNLGGFQNYLLGSIYQCKDCGFSEIWNGHNDNVKRDLLYVLLGVIGIGLVLAVGYFAFIA